VTITFIFTLKFDSMTAINQTFPVRFVTAKIFRRNVTIGQHISAITRCIHHEYIL